MTALEQFPIGDTITLETMAENPYPCYRKLQELEPVSWSKAFNMYLVTRYEDIQAVLLDTETYVAGTEHSLIMDTFGEQMLTTEGELHRSYKMPLLPTFRPGNLQELMAVGLEAHVNELIDGFMLSNISASNTSASNPDTSSTDSLKSVELRSVFASRLPIKTILSLFGLPQSDEGLLRGWYDAFEAALANFTWDADIRAEAHKNVAEFHDYLQRQIELKRRQPDDLLLDKMLRISAPRPLTDEEVRRNALIIFFGGISTVEALILNSLYALHRSSALVQRLKDNPADMAVFLEEVMRWLGPVQSATRHVTRDTQLAGVVLKQGDTVNCMIAAANHDSSVFPQPELFDMDRPNLRRHLGFAVGAHHCLGSHLAKLEAALAIQGLLKRLPQLRFDPDRPIEPYGYEFRQPREAHLLF